jgi:hypothetical protein
VYIELSYTVNHVKDAKITGQQWKTDAKESPMHFNSNFVLWDLQWGDAFQTLKLSASVCLRRRADTEMGMYPFASEVAPADRRISDAG